MCPQSLASKHGQFVRAFCRGLLAVASTSCRHLSWKPVPLHQMTLLGCKRLEQVSRVQSDDDSLSCLFPQGRDMSHSLHKAQTTFLRNASSKSLSVYIVHVLQFSQRGLRKVSVFGTL